MTTLAHRPVLRYHGGKWKLTPWIIKHLPPHRTYVEPFAGAASVLIRKPRSYAEILNDIDGEIVNVFRVLRNPTDAAELERTLQLTPFSRTEFEMAYEPTPDPVEQARRTIIRSGMGFGANATSGSPTGFRASSARPGSTHAHDWNTYPNLIDAFTQRLAGVTLENNDATTVMRAHDTPDTLHYVDPPYLLSTRAPDSPYCTKNQYRHELTDQQHEELLETLRALEGFVILSAYPNGLYDRVLEGWQRVERKAFADRALERTEVLWLNPHASEALAATTAQQPLFTSAPTGA